MSFQDFLLTIGFINDDAVLANKYMIADYKKNFMYYILDDTRGNAKITVCFNKHAFNTEILEVCNKILQGGFLSDDSVTKLQEYMTLKIDEMEVVATVNIFLHWSDVVKGKEFATLENLENIASGLEDYIGGQPVHDWADAMLLKDEDIDAGAENTTISDIVNFS